MCVCVCVCTEQNRQLADEQIIYICRCFCCRVPFYRLPSSEKIYLSPTRLPIQPNQMCYFRHMPPRPLCIFLSPSISLLPVLTSSHLLRVCPVAAAQSFLADANERGRTLQKRTHITHLMRPFTFIFRSKPDTLRTRIP